MKQLLILGLALITGTGLFAQKSFAQLPAKTKTKMAEEEQVASEADEGFQSLMREGMQNFEANNFDEAIAAFTKAGERRPINVYPPVMIEDVRLAKANYSPPAEEEEELVITRAKMEQPKLSAEERVEQMYQAELAKVYGNKKPNEQKPKEEAPKEEPQAVVSLDPEGMIVAENVEELEEIAEAQEIDNMIASEGNRESQTEIIRVKPQEEVRSIEEVQTELAEEFPDGITEKEFKEGNRTITERVVVKDGKGNAYRRVKHGWGGVFYFKNGTSITERVWNEETE